MRLGTKFYELLASMIANKSYEKIMDKSNQFKKKKRLGNQFKDYEAEELKKQVMFYHKEITHILD